MKKKLSALAIMAFLAGLTAFAGAQTTSTQPRDDKKASATRTATPDANKEDRNGHASSAKNKDNKKAQRKAKPAPSREEQEFEKVLRGIYG